MNYYKAGTWNAICDVCGFQYKADELLKRWDGLMVCKKDYETRHPLDFIRAVPDNQTVPFTRPEPADTFVTGSSACTASGTSSYADYAIASCATADLAPTF